MPRKTDEEIKARIERVQRDIEEAEKYGHLGQEDWMEAVVSKRTLEGVMGEER